MACFGLIESVFHQPKREEKLDTSQFNTVFVDCVDCCQKLRQRLTHNRVLRYEIELNCKIIMLQLDKGVKIT